jgi:hypothetical protein
MAHAYFEIVFDDSGSMDTPLAGSTRIEVAKNLFEDDIFPLIDSSTEVAVRLLRNDCEGDSEYHKFGTNRIECLRFIRGIYATKNTPLFNTMKDALVTTLASGAAEKTIFVLTDGGDTCGKSIGQVLTNDELKYFKQINVILAQFTVNSGSDVNQLSNFANTIGAKTFNFASGYGASITSIRTELKTALNVVGMNKNEPLRHCYEDMPGGLVYWKDIEAMGIQLHQARVLYDEHFLSWKPEYKMHVKSVELAELKFLYGIRFKTGIGVEMMRTMLSQLVKPYYYNSNCIYWHFEEARWKYFPQPAPIVVEPKRNEDFDINPYNRSVFHEDAQGAEPVYTNSEYRKNYLYRVESVEVSEKNYKINNMVSMVDEPHYTLQLCEPYKKTVKIREGDILEYVKKRTPGRPKKNKI